jgi:hypothetical protein
MLRNFFGKGKDRGPHDDLTDEQFDAAKQAALEKALGPMDEMVMHAIIPFHAGGSLDVYSFSKMLPKGGIICVTQELVGRIAKQRAKPNRVGYYELAWCMKPMPKGVSHIKDHPDFELMYAPMNAVAQYAFEMGLNPGETISSPADEKGQVDAAILFDKLIGHEPVVVNGETLQLLLCVHITQSELKYAIEEGTPALVSKLKLAGVWPYSVKDRKSAV